jgi:hypothetical protein
LVTLGAACAYGSEEVLTMSKWNKWILVGVLIAVPTLGYAVTSYRAHHACAKGDCPNRHAK